MAAMAARQRGRGGPGAAQWVVLGVAVLMVLGLTFALGMLVGRQWARQTGPVAASDAVSKPAHATRRGGLTEASVERTPELREKLTFYKTLTAPLAAMPSPPKTGAATRPGSVAKAAPPAEVTAPERGAPALARPASAENDQGPRLPPLGEASAPERGDASAPAKGEAVRSARAATKRADAAQWTVQVGVFKNLRQAESVKRKLVQGGFEAELAPITADDGQLRYRVSVGAFRSKDEAARLAARVRSDRSLPTFVTTR
jgi:cell division protein FtsN